MFVATDYKVKGVTCSMGSTGDMLSEAKAGDDIKEFDGNRVSRAINVKIKVTSDDKVA